MLSCGLRRVCPIHTHLKLFFINVSSIETWLYLYSKAVLLIFSGHLIQRIRLRHHLVNVSILFLQVLSLALRCSKQSNFGQCCVYLGLPDVSKSYKCYSCLSYFGFYVRFCSSLLVHYSTKECEIIYFLFLFCSKFNVS